MSQMSRPDKVNMEADEGEIFRLLGPMGATRKL